MTMFGQGGHGGGNFMQANVMQAPTLQGPKPKDPIGFLRQAAPLASAFGFPYLSMAVGAYDFLSTGQPQGLGSMFGGGGFGQGGGTVFNPYTGMGGSSPFGGYSPMGTGFSTGFDSIGGFG